MTRKLAGEETVYCVYILANKPQGTLYIGVTSDLINRSFDHRNGVKPGFTSRYGVKDLVYFEPHSDVRAAIQREKTLKKWPRQWKINLVEKDNPHWTDLLPQLTGEVGMRPIDGLPGQARQ
ncbi:MAG: GIY-YIG nuclease family protein [Rhizobiales bacterium]|nr:GIY-YIG nuclease family protein [Hyphomicrobiales bacterium]